MRQAKAYSSTRLSVLIRDPFVRAAFERVEDEGGDFGVLTEVDNPPSLSGGAAVLMTGFKSRALESAEG